MYDSAVQWSPSSRFIHSLDLVDYDTGQILELRGYSRSNLTLAKRIFELRRDLPTILLAYDSLDRLLSVEIFTSVQDAQRWTSASESIRWIGALPPSLLNSVCAVNLRRVTAAFSRLPELVSQKNEHHVAIRLTSLKSQPRTRHLTEEQLQATIRNEDHTLLVSAAGSGKTTVVIEKVRYIVAAGLAKPSEILVLAFNKKAATEVEERLQKVGVDGTINKTFHALGLSILNHAARSASQVQPDITPLAEHKDSMKRWIETVIATRRVDTNVLKFSGRYRYAWDDDIGYPSTAEYVAARTAQPLRTLAGEYVKSHGELTIADALYLAGIPYEYESRYPVQVSSPDRKSYKPDFTLPNNIFIEYWGTDRQGRTRQDIDARKYQRRMAWARGVHQQHQTHLIELFYFDHREGCLTVRLHEELRRLGVPLRPRRLRDVRSNPEMAASRHRLIELLIRFLSLLKGSGRSISVLTNQGELPPVQAERNRSFLGIFDAVLRAYEEHLRSRGEIDFDDMIGQSTEIIRSNRWISPFKYIIVDEFQDISPMRGALVRALRDQVPGSRVFCVGDDWQAINGFAGAQIDELIRFSEHFGDGVDRRQLTMTHRFPQDLAEVSTAFVMQNPGQLKKLVRSGNLDQAPVMIRPVAINETVVFLQKLLLEHPNKEIALLGRYNANLPEQLPEAIRFSTIHSAKGTEFDIVVIDCRRMGWLTFPSTVPNDPILHMLLPKSDLFPYAEERRLFYVALTRAKELVYVLTDRDVSPFVAELRTSQYAKWVDPGLDDGDENCPECRIGILSPRVSHYGPFVGCSTFPYCEYTQHGPNGHLRGAPPP
jgi:DNA helicase-4